MKGRCIIVGAGNFSGLPFSPNDDDLIIAADGGYDSLCRCGTRCDLLIGDLDSIESEPEGVEILRHPVKKDETDMHLCYLEGSARGYSDFLIFGGTGGREDHTYANYCLLLYIVEHGGNATLFSDTGTVYMVKNGSITLTGEKEKHLSVFPFGSAAHGVSVRGAEYECENITLTPDFPLAVSNRFLDTPATVSVDNGTLLIMVEE